MKSLSFISAINSEHGFKGTAAFDDYFSLSCKKYTVIGECSVAGVTGYRVEEKKVTRNLLLTVLKIISYATVLIPLIMLVGKVILRSRSHFFVASGLPPSTSSDPAHSSSRYFPPAPQVEATTREEIHQFKATALARLVTGFIEEDELPLKDLDNNESTLLNKVYDKHLNCNKTARISENEYRFIRANSTQIIMLTSRPDVVFKTMRTEEEADAYIALTNTARDVIKKNKLHLVHVPRAKKIKMGGISLVMQEKEELRYTSYQDQKVVYSYCWQDKELEPYITTLFSQYITFVGEMKFSDFKYDNIPISQTGRAGLIDLDNRDAVQGFSSSLGRREGGLFNYIYNNDHFHTLLEKAKPHLTEEEHRELVATLDKRASKRAQKAEHYTAHSEFIKKNGISHPSQKINLNLPIFFEQDKKKQTIAVAVLALLNHFQSSCFWNSYSRKQFISYHTYDRMLEEQGLTAQQGFPTLTTFTEILDKLKEQGYIHRYKIKKETLSPAIGIYW